MQGLFTVRTLLLSLSVFMLCAVVVPLAVSAQGANLDNTGTVPGGANLDNTGTIPSGNPNLDNTGSAPCQEGQLCNPLKAKTIIDFITQIIDIILVFALPIIILFIMYGGYLLVVAQGNPAKITEARNAIFAAVIGGVIVLGTKIIMEVIKATVSALGS